MKGGMSEEKTKVKRHLERKSPRDSRDFSPIAEKKAGVSKGYKAIDASSPDSPTFMVKTGSTEKSKGGFFKELIQKKDKDQSRQDMIREFIFAPIYKRLLFDRAPEINLVTKPGSKEIAIR